MHYRGTLQADGKEFDASYKRGTPLSFQLGAGRVIKGWDLGLLDMCPGDKRTLTIPPELGYGARGMGPIPASATLGEYMGRMIVFFYFSSGGTVGRGHCGRGKGGNVDGLIRLTWFLYSV